VTRRRRYAEMTEAFSGKGSIVEDTKDLRGALDEAMNFRGPALVNCLLSQGSAGKPQQFYGDRVPIAGGCIWLT
jgi:2-hydroxyacyl-CoA lyase 1